MLKYLQAYKSEQNNFMISFCILFCVGRLFTFLLGGTDRGKKWHIGVGAPTKYASAQLIIKYDKSTTLLMYSLLFV